MLEPVVPDGALVRRLAVHEVAVHGWGSREVRDLGDAVLLHDATDPEPYWNRIAAPDWPLESVAFERRLDEIVTLFATLDRLPHIRTLALDNRPPDLAARLGAAGFRPGGAHRRVVLGPSGARRALARHLARRGDLARDTAGA